MPLSHAEKFKLFGVGEPFGNKWEWTGETIPDRPLFYYD
jgi:hypothetical protein